jgi:hypothetical protein
LSLISVRDGLIGRKEVDSSTAKAVSEWQTVGEWGSFVAVSIVLAELKGLREDPVRKPRRNPKRRGELAEAAFLLKAQNMGFRVARPWGDSDRYDFISGFRRAVVAGAA